MNNSRSAPSKEFVTKQLLSIASSNLALIENTGASDAQIQKVLNAISVCETGLRAMTYVDDDVPYPTLTNIEYWRKEVQALQEQISSLREDLLFANQAKEDAEKKLEKIERSS